MCTASVLAAGRNLLLTAAHCLAGTGAGLQFVPGYDGTGSDPAPLGRWAVIRGWVPPGWRHSQDPQADYAILQVADLPGEPGTSVNQRSGGNLIVPVVLNAPVTVTAYNAGNGDAPISCTDAGGFDGVDQSFRCGGFSGGTSGAPWLQATGQPGRNAVVGVIGGPHQGGCTDDVSYSPRFGLGLYALLIRALLDLPGDDVPAAGDDGC